MSRKYALVAMAAVTACSADAHAFDLDPSVFSFSGFGTLSAVHSTEDKADFVTDFNPTGAGYSNKWSYDVDSLLALQMNAKLSDKLSAVVQLISKQQTDHTYRPVIEWANLKYSFTPDFSVRVGRIALPTYMASEVRNVHYAMAPVRSPLELYSLLPISNSDGVDVSYRFKVGKVSNTVTALTGENTFPAPAIDTKTTGMWGVVDNIEYGNLLLHVAYQGMQLRFESQLFFPPTGEYLSDLKIVDVGANYDTGTWYVTGEYGRVLANYGDSRAYSIMAGYRYGSVTPHVGYRKIQPLSATGFGGTPTEQSTATIGVRWDFMRNFDLKFQLDRVATGSNAYGMLANVQPGLQPNVRLNLISAAVDFVF